jgi:hypothetical protein
MRANTHTHTQTHTHTHARARATHTHTHNFEYERSTDGKTSYTDKCKGMQQAPRESARLANGSYGAAEKESEARTSATLAKRAQPGEQAKPVELG